MLVIWTKFVDEIFDISEIPPSGYRVSPSLYYYFFFFFFNFVLLLKISGCFFFHLPETQCLDGMRARLPSFCSYDGHYNFCWFI